MKTRVSLIYFLTDCSTLEEVYQQSSFNINFLPVSYLVKMNNFFGQYLHGGGLQKKVNKKNNNKNIRFSLSRYSVVACHKLGQFNSQVFTLNLMSNCCRLYGAKKFSKRLAQFIWVTRETRYHVSIAVLTVRNRKIQVGELARKPTTLMKTF